MPKIFNLIFISVIIIQVVFSFFYSSEIITQNNQLYENQQQYQILKIEQQILEKKHSELTSLYHLDQLNDFKNSTFIKNTINLNE